MTEPTKQKKDHPEEELLSIQEAAELLEISEAEVHTLVDEHRVPRHTAAGSLLRLKKRDIEDLKIKWRIQRELFPEKEPFFSHHNTVEKAGFMDKLVDFWYFNDFYILCSMLILVLLYFIIATQ